MDLELSWAERGEDDRCEVIDLFVVEPDFLCQCEKEAMKPVGKRIYPHFLAMSSFNDVPMVHDTKSATWQQDDISRADARLITFAHIFLLSVWKTCVECIMMCYEQSTA